MKGFSETWVPGREEDKEAQGRKLDLALIKRQADLVAEQLREEGRDVAADIVEDLTRQVSELGRDLEEVRADLARRDAKPTKRATVKTSGGKDRASASGTINSGGKAPPQGLTKTIRGHKHKFDAAGVCTAWDWSSGHGQICQAKRQRAARKPKQTTIPGTDGANPASAGGSL